jgi:hypothetical protein
MKSASSVAAAVGLALTVAAASSSAQAVDNRPVSFGIMGGAAIPVAGFPSGQHVGWNGGALLELGAPLAPLRFRIEGQWSQLNGRSFPGSEPPCAPPGCTSSSSERIDVRVIDATADALYTFASELPVKFYVIGGAGAYNVRGRVRTTTTQDELVVTTSESASSTKFGVNGGVGAHFRLNGFATFVEARYHLIVQGGESNTDDGTKALQMIPISVGITF